MNDLTGSTLSNRYQVKSFLGKGGMGSVYCVWDRQRAAPLAIKVLAGDIHEQPELLSQLRAEAETLAKLQHPHIVRSYGLGSDGELAFILMDFVDGSTLKERIAQAGKPLDLPAVIEIFRPVCTALHYAHSQGIVHCDVKPANILIDRSGRIFLSDFGLARLTEQFRKDDRYGGTPAYMSPEQVGRQPLTPQTDVYALGVILFEMFSGGKRPFNGLQASFSGSTPEKIGWEQVYLPAPALREQNPAIPPGLEQIVLRCLQKNPTQRYASAVDLFNDLQRFQAGPGDTSRRAATPPKATPVAVRPTPVLPQPTAARARSAPVWIILILAAVALAAFLLIKPSIAPASQVPALNLDVLSVPSLEKMAPEPEADQPEPGKTYTYTVRLDAPERLRWGFSWCAASQATLDDNLANMEFHFTDQQNRSLNLGQFDIYNYKQASLFCRYYYRFVVEGWADGRYRLSTDVVFLRSLNDGQDAYPAGTVGYRYDIQIGRTVVP